MAADPTGAPDRFRLLYVCTGNICRSPFAQFHTRFLLEARLGPGSGGIQVASAGTGAVVGHGMHPLSRAQLRTRRDHPDVEAFRARQVPERDVRLADLVLCVTRDHRSRVLQDVPQALSKAFTVREFARLVEAADLGGLPPDPIGRARALVKAALAARGMPGSVSAEEDAVVDPISGDERTHEEAARLIDAAVRPVVEILAPPPPPRPPGPPPGGRHAASGPPPPWGSGPPPPWGSGPPPPWGPPAPSSWGPRPPVGVSPPPGPLPPGGV